MGTASYVIQATPSPVYLVGTATAAGKATGTATLGGSQFYLTAGADGLAGGAGAVSLTLGGDSAAFIGSADGAATGGASLSSDDTMLVAGNEIQSAGAVPFVITRPATLQIDPTAVPGEMFGVNVAAVTVRAAAT